METNLQKWGNSVGVRIPYTMIKELKLHNGSLVEIKLNDGHISIYPKKYNLETMLQDIDESHLHTPALDDDSIGNEEW